MIIIAITIAGSVSAAEVPVLIYHRILSNPKEPGETVVSIDRFKEQMQYLKDNGYTTISMAELVSYMKGSGSVPDKAVVLTFDDGWKEMAAVTQILNQHNFKASFWIIPDKGIGGPYLDWNGVKNLASNPNFEIGAHTMTHPWDKNSNLVTWVDGKTPGKTEKDAEYEIKESKRVLESKLGKSIKYLAWPVGWYNDKLIQIAKDAGFEALLTVEDGANTRGGDVFRIRRIFIDGACDMNTFKQTLQDYKYHVCNTKGTPSLGNSPYGYSRSETPTSAETPAVCNSYDAEIDFTSLISDGDFTDKDAATPTQIQTFLEKMGSRMKDPVDGVLLSKAVYDAGQKYELSPIVLLATLQKEQSLLTAKDLSGKRKDYAAGCGCPDTSSCNPKYKGLNNQMECMARILKKWYDDGKTKTYPYTFTRLNYDNKRCQHGQPTELSLQNGATYSLYRYTPHTYDYCLWPTKGGANYNFRRLYLKYYEQITGGSPSCKGAKDNKELKISQDEFGYKIGEYYINPSFSLSFGYDFSEFDAVKNSVDSPDGLINLIFNCKKNNPVEECVSEAVRTVNDKDIMKSHKLVMFDGPCNPKENLWSDFVESFGRCSESGDVNCSCAIRLNQAEQNQEAKTMIIKAEPSGDTTKISLEDEEISLSRTVNKKLASAKSFTVDSNEAVYYVLKKASGMEFADSATLPSCSLPAKDYKICVRSENNLLYYDRKINRIYPKNVEYKFALEFS